MDVDVFSGSSRMVADTALPPSVVNILPQDPYLQLELAHKIVCHAYSSQVYRLEEEAQQLRSSFKQHQSAIRTLERKVEGLERDLLDQQEQAAQEQHQLLAEKAALIDTVKRLNREVNKLEQFKRGLLQQLQDDEVDSSAGTQGGGGALAGHKEPPLSHAADANSERLVAEVLHQAHAAAAAASSSSGAGAGGGSGGYTPLQRTLGSGGSSGLGRDMATAGLVSPGRSLPRGNQVSPPRYGSASYIAQHEQRNPPQPHPQQQQQQQQSQASLPQASLITQFGTSSLKATPGHKQQQPHHHHQQQPHSPPQQRTWPGAGSAASTPAAAGGGGGAASPRLEGKEFFRQARARLSYEQFSSFLGSIKELNAGRASREETLAAAQELFGVANRDLYGLFEALLSRHLTAL